MYNARIQRDAGDPDPPSPRNGDNVPRTFIALDLETTGLSPDSDAIIEIGAVKFRDGEPIDEFATLINPGRPIPYEITQLTGIRNEDVIGQPAFGRIAGEITRFVGDLPVAGHNVSFDLGFMRAQGLLAGNMGLDTWELATILLPNLSGYSLGALADRFALPHAMRHRAAADARAAGLLLNVLSDKAARLPRPILDEINRLARGATWALAGIFAEAAAASPSRSADHPAEARKGSARRAASGLAALAPDSPLFHPPGAQDPLVPVENPRPIDVDRLVAMLRPDGALSQALPGYEFRPPQVAMLEAVAGAFNQGHHLMAEAGTGTGKSLAYLLPAIAYAVQNSTRVVISTNTINLQDQLYNKDLPDLLQVFENSEPFRAALLKGRSNYLCPRRFEALMGRPGLSNEELRGIARILVWLPTTQSGDQSELSLPMPADRFVWSQVAADNEGCSLDRCQRDQGGRCFFYRARRAAESAHIIVINHALLMADAATANRVLPEYHHLIVDEAHHLEDAVTDQLSFRADSHLLAQLFAALFPPGGPSGRAAQAASTTGLLAEIQAYARRLPEEFAAILRDQLLRCKADTEAVQLRLDDFWTVMGEALRSLQPGAADSEYDQRLRITDATRSQPVWVEIEVSWENLSITWQALVKRLVALQGSLQDLSRAGLDASPATLDGIPEAGARPAPLERIGEELGSTVRALTELNAQLEAWVVKPDRNEIYWAEISTSGGRGRRITLRSAPLHVGPLVQEHILFRNDTVIITSATLRTAGSFDYLRDRLSAQEADTVTVGSPFDYKESTLLYLPTDLPEPTASGYQTAVEQALIGLARALGGRTLALFTSYAQLRRTAQAITPALSEAGITVLVQGGGSSRHQLLETFRSSSRTVLLGTRSFWEGVDVIGPALSALVLVRLPFAVPSDPVVAARSETFDDPFYHYQVPDAILRFRQGFGRLIRSRSDRGIVLVLDKRIQTKNYGQLFLESLPDCTIQRAPLMNLAAAAQRWVPSDPA